MISFPASGYAQAEDEQLASHVYPDSSYDAFHHMPAEHHQPLAPGPNQLQPPAVAAHFPLQFQPQFDFRFHAAADSQRFQADEQQQRQIQQQHQEFQADEQQQRQIQQQHQQFQAVASDARRLQSSSEPHPFPPVEPLQFQATNPDQLNFHSGPRRRVPPAGEPAKQSSVRKFHKADREKLRRDKLNEQFTELASVLEPDRPKNDKATILGDSVQAVRDLRADVRRLRKEHQALLDESRELTQEKSELREERLTLQTQTEQLQSQLQQRLQLLMPWMNLDMPSMMGRAPYPYHPVPLPVPPAGRPPATSIGPPGQVHHHQHPSPYGPFPVHPAYGMFGNRQADGSSPYMHYPQYAPPIPTHGHVERPYAQYASPIHPTPAYLMQMHPHHGPTSSPTPYMAEAQPPPLSSEDGNGANEASHSGPEPDQSTSSQHASQEPPEVQTTLQLQTGDSSAPAERPVAPEAGGGSGKHSQDLASSPKTHAVEVEESTAAAAHKPSSSAASAVSKSSASSAGSDIQGTDEGRLQHPPR